MGGSFRGQYYKLDLDDDVDDVYDWFKCGIYMKVLKFYRFMHGLEEDIRWWYIEYFSERWGLLLYSCVRNSKKIKISCI